LRDPPPALRLVMPMNRKRCFSARCWWRGLEKMSGFGEGARDVS
jgi:hypothetical protein